MVESSDDLERSRKDLQDSLKEISVATSRSFRRMILVQFVCLLVIAIAPFAGLYLSKVW